MITIIVQIFNNHGEVETEKFFSAKTKQAAAMMAGRWLRSGWGSEVSNWQAHKRRSVVSETTYYWEYR